jgi:tRNA pseudouridine55 synthase
VTGSSIGSGLVVVDKPAGWTSHDVVARLRRLAGTRKVGHAGTLDPMATGVLVIGVDRATRLLTFLVGADKSYTATIRLGVGTLTDDAEGEVLTSTDAGAIEDSAIRAGVRALTGQLQQVPSAVSAIKVDGKRSYARVRSGEQVELVPRPVTVHRFEVLDTRRQVIDGITVVDVDAEVDCTTGTYIRALARDLGAGLGIGAHLIALRRTKVGPFDLDLAHPLAELEDGLTLISLEQAARAALPGREITRDEAVRLGHGQRLKASGTVVGPVAAFDPDGHLIAIVEEQGPTARPLLVLAPR